MNTPPCVSSVSPYKGHRFPAEIISHSVWLYFRFSLSFRDVEEMMAEPGVAVSYETIREWCQKFGCPQGGVASTSTMMPACLPRAASEATRRRKPDTNGGARSVVHCAEEMGGRWNRAWRDHHRFQRWDGELPNLHIGEEDRVQGRTQDIAKQLRA